MLAIIAASSNSPELTEAVASRLAIPTYNNHNDLLRNEEVEWIVIATTSDKHLEWALKSIDADKNLIVEKPVAVAVKDAEEIFTSAKKAKVQVTVYQSRRWDEDFKLRRVKWRQQPDDDSCEA